MTKTLSASAIGSLGVLSVGAGATDDYTATNMEFIIDQAVGIVNTEVGLGVAYLTGSAGSKTASVQDDEFAIVGVLTLILALNAKLSREETTWSIERRNNAAEMVGDRGSLRSRYEGMVAAYKAGTPETSALVPRARLG